jgi:hypothetical protein
VRLSEQWSNDNITRIMGNELNCCGERKECMNEPTICLVQTESNFLLAEQANKLMAESSINFEAVKEEPLDISYTPMSSRCYSKSVSMSQLLEGRRILQPEEYKKIDLGKFLSTDDFSSVDFSHVMEEVACCPSEVFEMENGDIYKGEFNADGQPHGRGVLITKDGCKYIGYFSHGEIKGEGRLLDSSGVLYQGEFASCAPGTNGCRAVLHGLGSELWPNGIKYQGEFSMGLKQGRGRLKLQDCEFFGDFHKNQMHAEGTMVWQDGKKYVGSWKKGLMHGKGVFSWPGGKVYEGEYRNGEKDGEGTMKWPDGRKYQGMWKEGKQHGPAVYTYFDKNKQKFRAGRSEWVNGCRQRWVSPSNIDNE